MKKKLARILLLSFSIFISDSDQSRCSDHQFLFFGRCFCKEGWGGEFCDETLDRYSDCECRQLELEMQSFRCHQLCGYIYEAGVVKSRGDVWTSATLNEFKYWDDQIELNPHINNDRTLEHWEGFDHFQSLNELYSFGKIVELGAGPFTQVSYLLEVFSDKPVTSVSLVEPNLFRYVNFQKCPYANGTLKNIPTVLISAPVELIEFRDVFDTLIHINVLEHVQDALLYLEKAYEMLKPGGLLIFHERWFEDPETGNINN